MSQKKIKVLMLVPSLNIGSGITSYAMAYIKSLNHQNVQMDFACFFDISPNTYDVVESFGGNVFILSPMKKIKSHIAECKRILREGAYDVVHDNTLIVSLPMMICARKFSKIRILHSHSTGLGETLFKSFRNAMFLPFLKKCATNYAACSPAAAKTLFGHSEYEFIPNVVTGERFYFNKEKRDLIRKSLNVSDKKVIGSIGVVTTHKNPFFAVDIMKLIMENNHSLEYWWIGAGPQEKELADYVESLGLSGRIKLLGKRTDVPDLLLAMDMLLFPSAFEGLGLAGVEAQISGLPVIASDSIPLDMKFTDLVSFIPLSDGVEKWARIVDSVIDKQRERRTFKEELDASIFSNIYAGERLESYYSRLINAM